MPKVSKIGVVTGSLPNVMTCLRSAGHDITHIDMPLTPARVWAAMNN